MHRFSPWSAFWAASALCLALLLPAFGASAESSRETYNTYRKAIQEKYGIDIRQFKDTLKGGRADGKPITEYDLNQLLIGIGVEREHTTNRMRALEIATDHLEEYPDYYTRLEKMEEEAEADLKKKKK